MIAMMILIPLMAFPIVAFLVVITIISSWRWAMATLALGAVGLLALWIQHWSIASTPAYNEGPGGGLGVLIVGMWSGAFVIAAFTYVIGVAWWYEKS